MTKLIVTWGLHSSLLLLELHRAHATDCLFAFNTLLFSSLKNFLIFYAELASLDIKAIQRCNDCVCIHRLAEVRECQSAELTGLIKMIVESIGGRD